MPSNFFRYFVYALLLNIASPSYAGLDERYHVSLGANIETYNSKLSVNTNKNNEYSLEDSLGLDKKVNANFISAWYRVGDNHRIKFTYIPIERSSTIQNDRDVTFNDTTIKAGASISTKVRTEIIDFSYIYSLYKTPQLELGLSAGIYGLFNSTKILAQGQVIAEGDDQPAFKSDYSSEQKLQAPMPLIGISANYEFSPAWRTHATFRYLSVQIGEIGGRILNAEIGGEYYFNDNWGAGLAVTYFDLDVNSQNIIANTTLGWSHEGVQIYAIFKY